VAHALPRGFPCDCAGWFAAPPFPCAHVAPAEAGDDWWDAVQGAECAFTARDFAHALAFYAAWQVRVRGGGGGKGRHGGSIRPSPPPSQAVYLFKTEVVEAAFLSAHPEVMTSMRWLASARQGTMYRATRWVARRLRMLPPDGNFASDSALTKAFFVLAQLVYTALTLAPVPLLHRSFAAGLAAIIGWTLCVMWNGSNFYFEVFVQRYARDMAAAAAARGAGSETDTDTDAAHVNGDAHHAIRAAAARYDPDAEPVVDAVAAKVPTSGAGALPSPAAPPPTIDTAPPPAASDGSRRRARSGSGSGAARIRSPTSNGTARSRKAT
jgi:hypothetical protein